MAKVRVRQHVNPLSHKYRTAIVPPSWTEIYADITRPIHLDIGCARGKFLLQMAPLFPNINFLGIEIRETLVKEAHQQAQEKGLDNVCFIYGNINTFPEQLLQSLPGKLVCVSIQFPDPWFKRRHAQRRVVQAGLVNALAQYIQPEGLVFLQSDVEDIALEMTQKFQENSGFKKETGSLEESIFPVATERESSTISKDQPVYRSVFKKVNYPEERNKSHNR
ncbi:MAG: tRNA (guanine-N(7)-)-methyltransferase [Chroococcopsis gigantea SAG 12.99]|jgi:tRNA (guanine-N7-)-methyltransferase|nr:tRNA (guanine-N(7)-)-methyltransferase [Chroococcopsis gigantea SAG 12.99]